MTTETTATLKLSPSMKKALALAIRDGDRLVVDLSHNRATKNALLRRGAARTRLNRFHVGGEYFELPPILRAASIAAADEMLRSEEGQRLLAAKLSMGRGAFTPLDDRAEALGWAGVRAGLLDAVPDRSGFWTFTERS